MTPRAGAPVGRGASPAVDRAQQLRDLAERRILLLDGAMGTEIQSHQLTEADFRGDRYCDHDRELLGNNDILSLTRPDIIASIHRSYFEAGADIAETNSFAATSISQADFGLADHAFEINRAAAAVAREVADEFEAADPGRPRFVAGILGPTNKTATISPDVNDPAYRDVTFDALRSSYADAAAGLLEGGADILMIETVFDTLNAKAAVFAVGERLANNGKDIPVMISGTITDLSGRTLSGQTTTAFWYALRHAKPFSIGLNCALGTKELRQYVAELAECADCPVSAHPNAGLPNAFGGYDQSPADMADQIGEWARSGLINIIGGCCGTTPAHLHAISEAVAGVQPRPVPTVPKQLRLAGLEPFVVPQ